jgi:hypothetical protein
MTGVSKPVQVTVAPGETAHADIVIDTGIR